MFVQVSINKEKESETIKESNGTAQAFRILIFRVDPADIHRNLELIDICFSLMNIPMISVQIFINIFIIQSKLPTR